MDVKFISKEGEGNSAVIKVMVTYGKKKIIFTNTFNGEDVRQAAADVVLGNDKKD